MKISILLLTLSLTPMLALSQEQQIKLSSSQGPITLLKNLTNVAMPSMAPGNRACTAQNGDQAQVLYQMAGVDPTAGWLRIKMITGSCAGEEGWISSDNAQQN